MATCPTCNREMLSADGCIAAHYEIEGQTHIPIRYGDETRFGADWKRTLPEDKRCHDCNCKKGQFHHPRCDMEECAHCHKQIIGCDCEKK